MPVVAVLGVGRIGLPVVHRLVAAGEDVRAFDVRAELSGDVRAAGATWAENAAAAVADAQLVLTVLPGSPELRELVLGPDALLDQLRSGTAWVDLTSAAPDLGAELATAARQRRIPYLDAAIGGGPDAARTGTLTLYVGGDGALLDRVRPQLTAIARADGIHHMGAAGTGYLTKLIVNALWFTQAVATGELLLAGQRAGITPEHLRAVLLSGPAASDYVATYLPQLLAGDYLNSFGLDRIVEELESLERHLSGEQLPVAVLSRVTDVHRAALARLGPVDGELAAVAELEHRAATTPRHDAAEDAGR